MMFKYAKKIALLFIIVLLICTTISSNLFAAGFSKLAKPPLEERWFGIYVDNDRVGFYTQRISETPEGYRIDTAGSVRMRVMGFSKESTSKETFYVSKALALRSFDVTHNLNGVFSRVTGKKYETSLKLKVESNGKSKDRLIKFSNASDIYPGPVLNLYPMLRERFLGKTFKILTFDQEELKVKEVAINVLGVAKAPNGMTALKLRNNLYPFVHNDIWVDALGNTLWESVRDGLVITKQEQPGSLGAFVANIAISRKDPIYGFSLVKSEPQLANINKIKALYIEITGWDKSIQPLNDNTQSAVLAADGSLSIKTGITMPQTDATASANDHYLKPEGRIECDAPAIINKAKELVAATKTNEEAIKVLASWTSEWLKDSMEDGGGALSSLNSKYGNSQTHTRLFVALSRAAGIPSRYVTGLTYADGKGFFYHCWAESLLNGRWVVVDPYYNQCPADVSHLKLVEGQKQENLAQLVSLIGKINIKVVDTKF